MDEYGRNKHKSWRIEHDTNINKSNHDTYGICSRSEQSHNFTSGDERANLPLVEQLDVLKILFA